VIVAPIDWSKGTAATQVFEGIEKSENSQVDFLTVIGDGRDDEVIFRWANELEREKKVKHVTTVSLGTHNTEAGYTLTQGVTGMVFSSLVFRWHD
jgi:trehalose-6-phosphatase